MSRIEKEEKLKEKFIQLVDYFNVYLKGLHEIEDIKITLIQDKKFEIFQSFTRIDVENKGYINKIDIENFLAENKIRFWNFDAKIFIDSLSEDGKSTLEFNQFSKFLLPTMEFNKEIALKLSERPIRSIGRHKKLKPNLEILLSDLVSKHIKFEKGVLKMLKRFKSGVEDYKSDIFYTVDFKREGYIDIKKFYDFLIINDITDDQEDAIQLFKTLIPNKHRRRLKPENFLEFLTKKNIDLNLQFEKECNQNHKKKSYDNSHLFGLSYDIADEISIIKAKKEESAINIKEESLDTERSNHETDFVELRKNICRDLDVLTKRFESEDEKLQPESIKRTRSRSKESYKKPPLSSKSSKMKSYFTTKIYSGNGNGNDSPTSDGMDSRRRNERVYSEDVKPFGSPVYKLQNSGYLKNDIDFFAGFEEDEKKKKFKVEEREEEKIFKNIQITTSRTNDFDDLYENHLEDFPPDSPPGVKVQVSISDFCIDTTNEFKGFYEVDCTSSGSEKDKSFDIEKLEILDSEFEEIVSESEFRETGFISNREEEEQPLTFKNQKESVERIQKYRKYFEEGRDISCAASDLENTNFSRTNENFDSNQLIYESKRFDFDTNNRMKGPHKISVEGNFTMDRSSNFKKKTGREADILKIRLMDTTAGDKYNYNSKTQSYYSKPILEVYEDSEREQDKENKRNYANIYDGFKSRLSENHTKKIKPFELQSQNRGVFSVIKNVKSRVERNLKEALEDFLCIEKKLENVRCALANSKDFNVAVLYEYLDNEFKGFVRREELAEFTKIIECYFNLHDFNLFADGNFGTKTNSISFKKFSQIFYPASSQSFEKMRQKMYSENSRTRFDKFTEFTLINLKEMFNLLFELSRCSRQFKEGFEDDEIEEFFYGVAHGRDSFTLYDLMKYKEFLKFSSDSKKKLFEKLSLGKAKAHIEDVKQLLA